METRASYALVGAFVLLMVALFFTFILFVAKVQFDTTTTAYHAYFDGSVTGLQNGSAVRYRGVSVGVVSDVRIASDDTTKVRVTMDIDSATPITTDCVATIEMQGITGLAYIQITGGSKNSPPIARSFGQIPVIPSKPSQIEELVDAAPRLLKNLVDLTNQFSYFITPENAASFNQILANTAKATATAQQVFADLAQITPKARNAMTSFTATVDDAKKMIEENRQPLNDFTTTGLYDMALLMAEMRELVGHLSRISGQIERDPGGFILAGPRSGETPAQAAAQSKENQSKGK